MSTKAEDAAAAAAAEMDDLGKRKFFPRVKHLIGNKEWEDVSNHGTIFLALYRSDKESTMMYLVSSFSCKRMQHSVILRSISFFL